jgi:hypothetical protein
MVAARCLILAASGLAAVDATGVSMSATMSRANPIRKVVTMIQNIQKKVEKEGKAAEDLFEKFMCECGQQQKELTDAIAAAEAAGSDNAAAAEAGDKQAKQLQADITQAKKDRAAAKDAISSATEIREKEAAAFKDMHAEASANIEAMGKAIQAIESAGSSFLQTTGAQQLRDLVQSAEKFQDKDEVLAFLSGEESSEGSGEIVGVLKQQQETMASDLKEAEGDEADAKSTYGDLVKAKTKEFETLQASIEEKMARLGELSVANAEAANAGGDTAEQLVEDKKALADSKTACANREKAFEKEKETRAQEVLALADTVKLLNSDDALELFKKALPSASSFMQVTESSSTVKARALATIQEARKHQKGGLKLDFVALALRGRKVGFEKVIALIDKFIGNLKADQKADDDKVAYCKAEFDKADDEKKALERKVSDAETAIKDAKETVATLIKEIEDTKAAIVNLDNDVAIATAQRQQENGEYKTLITQNTAAMSLIKMAIKRMNKFYNPSFIQNGEATHGGNAVITMMTTLVTDLEQENAVAKTAEGNAQADYEKFMADTKEQRIADAKLLEDKEAAKGEADEAVQSSVDAKTASGKELQGVLDYIMGLRADCDFVMKYYDTRKQARSDEIDALGKAKDVLQGADYSFVQLSRTHRHLRSRQN